MVPCQKVAKRLFPQSSREEVASMTLTEVLMLLNLLCSVVFGTLMYLKK